MPTGDGRERARAEQLRRSEAMVEAQRFGPPLPLSTCTLTSHEWNQSDRNLGMRAPKAGGYEFADEHGHFIAWPELATEVLSVVRLIDEHGRPGHLIKMERTPLDVCTFASEDTTAPVVIATEEKHSPDHALRLLVQLRSFARRRLQPDGRSQLDPSERQDFPKYLGPCGLNAIGEPVHAPDWFVIAAPTVWRAFRVAQQADHAVLEEIDPGDLPKGD